jgi:hypothetical protein
VKSTVTLLSPALQSIGQPAYRQSSSKQNIFTGAKQHGLPAAGSETKRNTNSSAAQAKPRLAVPQLNCCINSYRLAIL